MYILKGLEAICIHSRMRNLKGYLVASGIYPFGVCIEQLSCKDQCVGIYSPWIDVVVDWNNYVDVYVFNTGFICAWIVDMI